MTEPTQAPGGKMRRVALTAKEEQIITDYRRKTEADRAFNDGLDHALECVTTITLQPGVQLSEIEINSNIEMMRKQIEKARRDV